MKATGIVRRLDDLGRIVIPKELRRQLFGTPEKSEGMPMEIFIDKDEIIIRKYEADDVCEWKRDDTFRWMQAYKAGCCNKILDLTVRMALEMNQCPYCGKKIKVVE